MSFLGNSRLFSQSAQNLKILKWFRISFCIAIFFEVLRISSFFSSLQKDRICYPIEIFRWLSIPEVSSNAYQFLIYVLLASLTAAAFGVFQRSALFVALVLFVYVFGIAIGCDRGKENFYTSWQHCIVVFTLLVLLVTPKNESRGWPIEILKFNILVSYFAGGIVKIKTGFDWMNGYTLQYYFIKRHLIFDSPLAFELAQSLTLMKFFSISTVIMELLIPIAWFTRRQIGWMFMVLTLVLQILCWYLLDLKWFAFYGWTYLIYLFEIIFYFSERNKINNRVDLFS